MGPVNTSGQDSLERAVREAGIEVPPVWFDEVGSTNDEARRLADEGAPEWTVVAAGHQTAGRGRLGRTWADVPGKALLFSVVLRPELQPEEAPVLGLLAAVAMIAAADRRDLRSKWPNDLVIGNRKAGGILTEAGLRGRRLSFVVIGAGVNLALQEADLPEDLRLTATSLFVEPEALLTGFLNGLRGGMPRSPGEIVSSYRDICTTLGREVRATTTSGRIVEGRAVDVAQGGLVVEAAGSLEMVPSGEVVELR